MSRPVRLDQAQRILALAESLGPEVVTQARQDLRTMTVDVARFYIDTLVDDLRRVDPTPRSV